VEHALGVGGFFFRTRDPKALLAWYRGQLGIEPDGDFDGKTWQIVDASPFPLVDLRRTGPCRATVCPELGRTADYGSRWSPEYGPARPASRE
jgi:hypothetical protein